MTKYICYFDASFNQKTKETGLGFIILNENKEIIYEYMKNTYSCEFFDVEKKALGELLKYIDKNFNEKSHFLIYGDCLSTIGSVRKSYQNLKKKNRVYVKLLYDYLCFKHNIELLHISRKHNKRAHTRAHYARINKRIPKMIYNNEKWNKKVELEREQQRQREKRKKQKYKVNFNYDKDNIIMEERNLNELQIPNFLKYSKPNVDKYNKLKQYFLNYGKPKKEIYINKNNILIDGFITYLLYRENNLINCQVAVVQQN